jgi:threonine synthase
VTRDTDKVRSWYDDLKRDKYFKVDDMTLALIKKDFMADWCDVGEALDTIMMTFKESNVILDPHTAVGVCIANRHKISGKPILVAGTAHYGKFPESVMKVLNIPDSDNLREVYSKFIELGAKNNFNDSLLQVLDKPVIHTDVLNPDLEEIKSFIFEKIKKLNI